MAEKSEHEQLLVEDVESDGKTEKTEISLNKTDDTTVLELSLPENEENLKEISIVKKGIQKMLNVSKFYIAVIVSGVKRETTEMFF